MRPSERPQPVGNLLTSSEKIDLYALYRALSLQGGLREHHDRLENGVLGPSNMATDPLWHSRPACTVSSTLRPV